MLCQFYRVFTAFTILFLTACASTPSSELMEEDFSIEELRLRAKFANEAGAHSEALLNYTRILAEDPEHLDSLIGAGETLLAIDKPRRAEKYFDRALHIQQKNTAAREGRALAWLMTGSYTESRTSLLNLVDDGVDHWRVWNALGIIADLNGNYDDAVAYYKWAIELSPERSMLKNNLGYSLIMNREYSRAESVLSGALKRSPTNGRIVNNLAMAIAWQGRYEEAVMQLKLVMDEASGCNNVGYIAYLAGDYDQAETLFRRALALKPSYYKRAADNLELVLTKKK